MVKKSLLKFINKCLNKFKKKHQVPTNNPHQTQIVQETPNGNVIETYDTVISFDDCSSYTSDITDMSDESDMLNDRIEGDGPNNSMEYDPTTEYQSINGIWSEPTKKKEMKSSDGHYGAISDVPL